MNYLFWIGAVIAASSVIISFVYHQKTPRVRVILLVLGMVGIAAQCGKYYYDQQRNAPRHLSWRQVERIVESLKPFSGQSFQMITYPKCGECSNSFMLIYDMLIRAGWTREGPPNGIPIGAMQSVLVNVSDTADGRTKHAAGTLVDALNSEGIVAELDNETDNPALVDIIVGLKP